MRLGTSARTTPSRDERRGAGPPQVLVALFRGHCALKLCKNHAEILESRPAAILYWAKTADAQSLSYTPHDNPLG